MSFWDGNYIFGGYPGGYSDGSDSRVAESNQEEFRVPLPDLNDEPEIESSFLEETNKEFFYSVPPSYTYQNNPDLFFDHCNSEFGEPSSVQELNEEQIKQESNICLVDWETNQDFLTEDELVNWIVRRGRDNGYVIVRQRSKQKKGLTVKIWFMCDRGGEHTSTASKRNTGTKKIRCPFQLVGKYDYKRNAWTLHVKNTDHNHDPALHLEGHPYMRRLTDREYSLVGHLTEQHMEPRNILSTIKKQNPANVSIVRDVYNAQQKIKSQKQAGDTPMQRLETLLHSKKYIYYTREDPRTNVVEDIFFIPQDSYATWRAFPHVLMMDATYKTNMYNLPFVQIIGVTSTYLSFSIAYAFISKEKEDNYLWVVQKVKDMLEKCMEPRVIITDRELSLMNACKQVFPNANRYLCMWHINENINKHCKGKFPVEDDWNKFTYLWGRVCDSSSLDIYEYNYNRLYERLIEDKRESVLEYVTRNWLNPYKEMFVQHFTNRTRNFGQRTTNRVESQHRNLKRYLKGAHNTLDKLVGYVDSIVASQQSNIKHSFETSKIKEMSKHKLALFDNLRGKVSHKALDLLVAEKNKLKPMREHGATCGCILYTGFGLPCSCRMEKYENTGQKIPLHEVDIFWTKLEQLKPAFLEGEEIDVEEQLDLMKQEIISKSPLQKKNIISKLWATMRPGKTDKKAPTVNTNVRGRPTLKAQQQKNQEPPRHSSFEPSSSFTGTQLSLCDPPRHSSFAASEVKSRKPAMQRSQSTSSKARKPPEDLKLSQRASQFPLLVDNKDFNKIARFTNYIPTEFHRYIKHIQDVKPDGNCGFRAVAVGLGLDEFKWPDIRTQLLEELTRNEWDYRCVLDSEVVGIYDDLYKSIYWPYVEYAPKDYWMQMPYTGIVIAQTYGKIVHLLSLPGCQTFFPIWSGPDTIESHEVVTVVHIKDHFIHVELEGDYPVPIPNILWERYRNEAAAKWEATYAERIKEYKAINRKAKQYVNLG